MAFMVPVMKNDFDLYKTGKNRRISECSSQSSGCRSRKLSERSQSESASLSTSPGNNQMVGSPNSMSAFAQRMQSRGTFSRTSSRASQSSLVMSPTRNTSNGSPPKINAKERAEEGSQGSLNKFHTRLVDKLKRTLKRDNSREGSRS